jgi:hypothetical protein
MRTSSPFTPQSFGLDVFVYSILALLDMHIPVMPMPIDVLD